jgi:putative endonuclease
LAESFTKRHGIKMLVYFEEHDTIGAALQREKISSTGPANGKST